MKYKKYLLCTIPLFSSIAYSQTMFETGMCVGAIDQAAVIRRVWRQSDLLPNEASVYGKYVKQFSSINKNLKNCWGENPSNDAMRACINQLSKNDREFFFGVMQGNNEAKAAPAGDKNASDLSPTVHRICYIASPY